MTKRVFDITLVLVFVVSFSKFVEVVVEIDLLEAVVGIEVL